MVQINRSDEFYQMNVSSLVVDEIETGTLLILIQFVKFC